MSNDDGGLLCEGITSEIIGAAIEVHKALGPGLLESAYEACMARELELRSVPFRRQLEIPVQYKGIAVDCGYRLDFLIAESVVVELKAVRSVDAVHDAQLLTNMRLLNIRVGLLINLHAPVLKDGIRRRVL